MFTSGMPAEFLWNTVLKFQHFFRGKYDKNNVDDAQTFQITSYWAFNKLMKVISIFKRIKTLSF